MLDYRFHRLILSSMCQGWCDCKPTKQVIIAALVVQAGIKDKLTVLLTFLVSTPEIKGTHLFFLLFCYGSIAQPFGHGFCDPELAVIIMFLEIYLTLGRVVPTLIE